MKLTAKIVKDYVPLEQTKSLHTVLKQQLTLVTKLAMSLATTMLKIY